MLNAALIGYPKRSEKTGEDVLKKGMLDAIKNEEAGLAHFQACRVQESALYTLQALDLAAIASRAQILQAENERLRARVEELEEGYERPRQRDRIDVAQ